MMTTTTAILDRLTTLCDETDSTLRQLNDIREGTIKLDRPEDEDDLRDNLIDMAYNLWNKIEEILNGNAALSDYEKAICHVSKSDELRRSDIEAGRSPFESGSAHWYYGQLTLIRVLFAIDNENDHIDNHVEIWNRAKDTIEKLREELYHNH